MWAWIWSWLLSFWKTAEEEIDPIGQEELELAEVLVDKNFEELPCHRMHVEYKAVFTQYSGFHVPMNFEGQKLVYEVLETRAHGSIYDASYKRQFLLNGKDSSKFLDALVTSDIESE
ncbi:hypothetical protein AVEN_177593-1 [Araneus ventricosus]|uniref:GCVT N-terminal domain-containing protein n=1 Tax=Araneus ventricosus TaxID=182803 RepID=A0A4Y2M311_ARAVE|nr:hypothetical protein AVEN_177580-1 [Araneus ventricosus]GBN20969.1 hypothetical protein AVEN_177593-1 [Araneus ventricosus]